MEKHHMRELLRKQGEVIKELRQLCRDALSVWGDCTGGTARKRFLIEGRLRDATWICGYCGSKLLKTSDLYAVCENACGRLIPLRSLEPDCLLVPRARQESEQQD